MADKKVSQLTALTGANTASGDLLYIVDVSEPIAADQSKKITLTEFQSAPVSAGTANGVAYLNGSKVLTTGSALTFSNGNFLVNGAASGSALSGDASVAAIRDSATANVASYKVIGGSSDTQIELFGSSSTTGLWTSTNTPMLFAVNNAEQMRLTSKAFMVGYTDDSGFSGQYNAAFSGNLGIGTSSPGAKLDVANTGGSVAARLRSSDSGYAELYFADVSDSAASAISYEHSTNLLRLYNGGSARVILDSSGNLGLGVTPSAWNLSGLQAIQIKNASLAGYLNNSYLSANAFFAGGWLYTGSGLATQYVQADGEHRWSIAPSGTAGNAISFSQVMTLTEAGNLGIGTTSPQTGLSLIKYGSQWTNHTSNYYPQPAGNTFLQMEAVAAQANWFGFTGTYGTASGSANLLLQVNLNNFNQQAGNYIGSEAQSATAADLTFGKMVAGASAGANSTKSEQMRLDSSGNLGLGVTPSALWSAMRAFQNGTATFANDTGAPRGRLITNALFNGSGYVFLDPSSNYALNYTQDGATGAHQWRTSTAAGTAPNGATLSDLMTLDASGNLLVGTTNTYSGLTRLIVESGEVRNTYFRSSRASGSYLEFGLGASGATIGSVGAGGQIVTSGATADLALRAESNLVFASGGATERARITSGGYFKASNDGTYAGSTDSYHELKGTQDGGRTVIITASNATNPVGARINYSGATPNGTGNQFIYCDDSTALRAEIRSNGGLANYQSNNVDLSDARTKTDINPLASYWNKIAALEIVTYKYKDQTHDDLNIGVIAQQVEQVAPEFVDADGFGETPEDGVPLKTIYNKDLTFAAIKALQEAMARIETLEAEVAALKGN